MGRGVWVPAFAGTTPWLWRPLAEIRLGVPGLVRQHAGVDADLAQRAQVFVVDVVAEDQIRVGVAMQPSIVLDSVFGLARAPSGIAQGPDCGFRTGALGV